MKASAVLAAMALLTLAGCLSGKTKPLVHRLDCTNRNGGEFRVVFDLAKDQIWILTSDTATEFRRVAGRPGLVLMDNVVGKANEEVEIADSGEATVRGIGPDGAVTRSHVVQCR